jgi:hypothetical protein
MDAYKGQYRNNYSLYMRKQRNRLPGATIEFDEREEDKEGKAVIILEPHDTIYLPNGAVYGPSR